MNSWQLRCITTLVNARPPTTKICLSYCFNFSTSDDEVAVAADDDVGVDVRCVNAISSASSARLMSAPFLSPPGVRLRWTSFVACCVSERL